MARPKKDNAEYFSHDNNMRNDPKIKAIRRKFKIEGYAIWNMLLEVLTEAENFNVKIGRLHIELMAGDFDCEPDLLLDLIEFCVSIELLHKDGDLIFSSNLKKRLAPVVESREKAKKAYEERLAKKQGVSTVETTPNVEFLPEKLAETTPQGGFLPVETTQSKVKESKVNNNDVVVYPTPPPFFTIHHADKALEFTDSFALHATRSTNKDLKALEYLKSKFIEEQKALSKMTWQNENDLKKHFINWCKKQATPADRYSGPKRNVIDHSKTQPHVPNSR